MIAAEVRSWCAWSPGCADEAAWRSWCASPEPLGEEGAPDVSFLPALLRRRCGPLARAALTAARGCCQESDLARVATVFASRHGNINESIGLLERLARREPLSPTRFSHTVHNAQAGLFSIAAGNREASSSIAGCESTFASGWLESLTLLQRAPERPVLLVVADAPLDPGFAVLVDEPPGFYALALLLEASPEGVGFRIARAGDETPVRPWPDALEFLRWHLSEAPRLEIDADGRRFVWERSAH